MRNNTLRSHFRVVTFAVLALAMAVGCTKKKEEKNEVDPNAYLPKSVFFDGGSTAGVSTKSRSNAKLFHLSRGVEEADSDNTVDATPGMSDDFGIVQARITEKELQFLLVFDPRGRAETSKIVASYPIKDHFDIVRDTNDFGEKTHKIVENRDKPWDQRAYMRVDWESPSNSLSNFAKTLGAEDVSEENTTLLETPNVNKEGYLNFLVETSIKSKQSMTFTFPYSIEKTAAYRVVYRTHLMPVKSNHFESVPYTLADFQKFGFFFTQQNFEDPEKGLQEKDIHLYANIHNVCEKGHGGECEKNKITWVLSKDFPEFYKDEARKAVLSWNDVFKAALNREDDVVVLDESVEPVISDPRYNIIAYYPERTNAGLLGVAQWVSDPRNGELVGVRATVYQDGINGTLGSIDTLIDILNSNDPIRDVIKTNPLGSEASYASPYNGGSAAAYDSLQAKASGLNKIRPTKFGSANPATMIARTIERMDGGPEKANARFATYLSKIPDAVALNDKTFMQAALEQTKFSPFPKTTGGVKMPDLGGVERLIFGHEQLKAQKAKNLLDAEKGIHGTELVEEAAIRYLMKLISKDKLEKIDDVQRKRIKDAIAKETFHSTLLHEMGHAFGLRHNFRGSSDPANFHAKYQQIKADLAAKKAGVSVYDLDQYAMSSIMDYGRDFYSDEGGLGSYDAAAIKYAYNRSIDKQNDPIVKRNFAFCTDHEVDETILCRRFDKGSNVSEITQATIDFYNRSYPLMHYRRGRISEGNWNGWGNPNTLVGSLIQRFFIPTRQVMDEFLYAFVGGEKVPMAERTGGYCDMKFIRDSIKAGEIASICTPQEMEAAGVDPTNMETFYNALFDIRTGRLRVKDQNPANYMPYGMGDLLWANRIAKVFFTDVLGSTEPGRYVAIAPQGQDPATAVRTLIKVPAAASDDEALTALAIENDVPADQRANFIATYKPMLVDVGIGRDARQLETVVARSGGRTTNEIMGSWWDKYAAVIALSIRDLGVEKYSHASMSSNVYFAPQTKTFGSNLFGSLIARKSSGNIMKTMKVVLNRDTSKKTPMVVNAYSDAALNLDVQTIAGIYAIGGLTTTSDMSLLNKVRVCADGEGGCTAGPENMPVTEVSVNGRKYRAAQTYENDSISFKLIEAAKAFEARRTAAEKSKVTGDADLAEALMKLEAAKEVRDRLNANFDKYPELKQLQTVLTGKTTNAANMSVWDYVELLKDNYTKLGYFTLSQEAEPIPALFDQAIGMMDKVIASTKDAQKAKDLAQIKADLNEGKTAIAAFLTAAVTVRSAPLIINSSTDSLERAESSLLLLRKLMKQEE